MKLPEALKGPDMLFVQREVDLARGWMEPD